MALEGDRNLLPGSDVAITISTVHVASIQLDCFFENFDASHG
jgi:hypothetical protein